MSDSYTKLFSSITESTVWGEPYSTRIVWVTMLAMANAKGDVYGSLPGLARRANVTLDEVKEALESFLAPDQYSRTKNEDGRRIEEIDGGWRLINHAKYSAVRNAEERKAYKREWDAKNRGAGKSQSDRRPTESDSFRQNPTNPTEPTEPTPLTLTPSLTLEEQELKSPNGDLLPASAGQPPCPIARILESYRTHLPANPGVRVVSDQTKANLRTRWREDPGRQSVEWWDGFFKYVATCDFLTGKKTDFAAGFDWLVKPSNFAKVVNGNYDEGEAKNASR